MSIAVVFGAMLEHKTGLNRREATFCAVPASRPCGHRLKMQSHLMIASFSSLFFLVPAILEFYIGKPQHNILPQSRDPVGVLHPPPTNTTPPPQLPPKLRMGFQPEFAEPLENLTIAVGRDATFRCMVQHLGGYRERVKIDANSPTWYFSFHINARLIHRIHRRRSSRAVDLMCMDIKGLKIGGVNMVGWVKADTKAIQAIHDHVITHNPRVSVSHSDHSTWNLHVRSVQEEDRGQYMCQINTDPMQSQMGHLDVVVPPDFVNEETSSDIMVPEGGTAKLICKARGYPTPHVTWRREDNGDIIVKEPGGKTKVSSYQGEVLKLAKITRSEMGAYLCIASNSIPPSVSKRILVNVNFHPVIQVPNQLVGAPTGTDVTLECYVEASPKSINYWVRDSVTYVSRSTMSVIGEMVISSEKYEVQSLTKSLFEVKMMLIIRGFNKQDVGSYRCIAKNSLGEVESNIRLYEIPGPTKKVYPGPPYDEEDQQYEVYGSAEDEDQDELSNSVQVVAGWGQTPTSGTPSRGTFNTVHVDSSAPSSASRPSSLLAWSVLLLRFQWLGKPRLSGHQSSTTLHPKTTPNSSSASVFSDILSYVFTAL
ncbi:hypothetical protein J6590_005987 [Homalodisca vitripennis]|nr:hypothetical protein J6590_005987 [Homalodisca vitripennis]